MYYVQCTEGDLVNIEKIDNQTVKIILSTSDMKDFKISYDEMDYNNPVARKAIISLLKLASTSPCPFTTESEVV